MGNSLRHRTEETLEVGYGSIYHALKSLQKKGLIREAGRAQDPGTPERILYERTPEGETSLIEAPWAATPPGYGARLSGDGLYLAALLALPPERRRGLLEAALREAEERFESLRGRLSKRRAELSRKAEAAATGTSPPLDAGLLLAERHLQHLFGEITWLESALEKLG